MLAIPDRSQVRIGGRSVAARPAVAVAGCGSAAASAGKGQIVGGRRRERVRERDLPDRGAVRGGDARSRATRTPTRTRSRRARASRRRSRGAAGGPERGRLRHVHEQDRVGLAELLAQGDRRPDAARACRTRRRTRTCGTCRGRCPRSRPRWSRTCRRSSRRTPPTSPPTRSGSTPRCSPGIGRSSSSPRATRARRWRPPSRSATTCCRRPGTVNLTPFTFQADIMNGVDPSPQDVTLQNGLFSGHRVKVFLYNQQVTDSLTESFLAKAQQDGIPVVGVYETMPTPGLRLPVVDAGRGQRAAAGGRRRTSRPRGCSDVDEPTSCPLEHDPGGAQRRGRHASASAAGRCSMTSASRSGPASSPG